MHIQQFSTLPGASQDPSVVGLLRVDVPVATQMVHQWQYGTIQDSLIPIYMLIHQLESQGLISKICSPLIIP